MNKFIILQLFFSLLFSVNSLNIDLQSITTSGISSGSYFANQFHFVHSRNVIGAVLVAGGPYLCSEGVAVKATLACMNQPYAILMANLYTEAKWLESLGKIDSLDNLKKSTVFLLSGTLDTTILKGVVEKQEESYRHYGANVITQYRINSEHSWVTSTFKNKCSFKGAPYMNNCDYNAPYNGLKQIFPSLKEGKSQIESNLKKINQRAFSSAGDGLHDNAYVYIPTSCQNGEFCKVHIAFSGCEMTLDDIGLDFVKNSQLNEIGEANNIIILYPQVKKSNLLPYNPKGCWDWWGYTELYPNNLLWATRDGKQIKAVWDMVQSLATGNFTMVDE